MSLIPGRLRASSRSDLVVGGIAVVVVFGLAVAEPGDVGFLLAGLAVGAVVFALAVSDPLLALLLVVVSSFLRTAQKEFVSVEALTPAFWAMLLALALALARRAKDWPRLGVVEWLMAAYLAWNITSMLIPHEYDAVDPVTGTSIDTYRWLFAGVMLPLVVYVVAKSVLDDERSVRWLLWTTVGMSAYSSWVSILQFHGPKSLVWPSYIVDAPNWEGRANGVFNQPVVNGLILVVGFVVCLFLADRPGTRRWVRFGLWALAGAAAYSVYLTHTRAALLALIVVLGLGIVLASGWRRGFVVSAVLGLLAVAANASTFFSSDRSAGGVGSSNEVYDRLNIMATCLRAVAEHPFVGIGLGRFEAYNTSEHVVWSQEMDWNRGWGIISHQNELGIAAELGIPGVLLWIAVVVAVMWTLWRAIRELPRDEFLGAPLAVVGAMVMVVMVVNGLTVDLRILDFAGMLPFLYAGMVAGQLDRHRRRRPEPRNGTAGAGLPGGMSPAEVADWEADHRRLVTAK
ncbi:O-antigen ligase family protein [Actinomycetospora sp. CA-101289]|uniref:O-antigen ligase family protein n=1 Tax=Actinomycetospora sp. CA-101289 TaxID=3239893 RepID=UPI003D99CA3C